MATPRGASPPFATAANLALSGSLSARSGDAQQQRLWPGGCPYEVTLPRPLLVHPPAFVLPEALPTVIVMGGPQGSGKTMLSTRIAKQFHYDHLNWGDVMQRERSREGSDWASYLEAGLAVPPDLMMPVLKKAMETLHWRKGKFIVDDFPMDEAYFEAFLKYFKGKVCFKYCLYLDCAEATILERPAPEASANDIQRRFAAHVEAAGPVIGMLRYEGLLRRVDCNRDVQKVWTEVERSFMVQEHKDSFCNEQIMSTPVRALYDLREKQSEEIFPAEHGHIVQSHIKAPVGFTSYNILAKHKVKHTRNMHGPHENFYAPVALSQEIGWHSGVGEGNQIGSKGIPVGGTTPRVFHPKSTCSMTRHMENMYNTNAQHIIRRW